MTSFLQPWTSTSGWAKISHVSCAQHQKHSMEHQGTIKFWGASQQPWRPKEHPQIPCPKNIRCNTEHTLCPLRWRKTIEAPFISWKWTAGSSQGLGCVCRCRSAIYHPLWATRPHTLVQSLLSVYFVELPVREDAFNKAFSIWWRFWIKILYHHPPTKMVEDLWM